MNILCKFLILITPKYIKKFVLSRIVQSINIKLMEEWSNKTMIPLHQKIENIESEIEKIKEKLECK